MDPNAARQTVRKWAKGVVKYPDQFSNYDYRVAESFLALDQWLSNGGFLPTDWERK